MGQKKKENETLEKQPPAESGGFLDKYGAIMVLSALLIYIILLGLGVFAEVFKIQSILDWWIWRP
jgi:hypothetical protein